MKTIAALLFAAVTLGGAAEASYRDLVQEWNTYQPPTPYRAPPQGTAPAPRLSAPSASDADFPTQIDRLRELKAGWEKALESPAAEPSFYTPNSVAEMLRAKASDPAAAQEALVKGFTLETLETLALLRNPSVRVKETELRAVIEGYSQVENLDTLLRRYSTFTAGLMTGVGSSENPESVALKFPFPGVLALKGEAVGQDVRAARQDLEIARREAVTRARRAYWELLYLQGAQGITSEMLSLLENLRSAASTRYAAGQTSFQDVVKVGIEQEKTEEELVSLERERRQMQAEVAELLDLPSAEIRGTAEPREPDRRVPELHALYAPAREKKQELLAARAMIGKMERMLEMSETMIYPGFSLNLSLREKDEVSRVGAGASMKGGDAGSSSFPTVTTASMGEGLPKMPWYGKDEAYLRETRQKVAALKSELVMKEAATRLQVHEAWTRLDKARREEALYADRVLPLSQGALDASNRGYSAGKVMFSDLIEFYNAWLSARLGAERARADLGIARADLEAAVGTTALP